MGRSLFYKSGGQACHAADRLGNKQQCASASGRENLNLDARIRARMLFVRISGPSEGLRLGIVFDDKAIDGGLQIDDRDEDTALQSPLGSFAKKPSTALSHAVQLCFSLRLLSL
jgi:hypothetical protein